MVRVETEMGSQNVEKEVNMNRGIQEFQKGINMELDEKGLKESSIRKPLSELDSIGLKNQELGEEAKRIAGKEPGKG